MTSPDRLGGLADPGRDLVRDTGQVPGRDPARDRQDPGSTGPGIDRTRDRRDPGSTAGIQDRRDRGIDWTRDRRDPGFLGVDHRELGKCAAENPVCPTPEPVPAGRVRPYEARNCFAPRLEGPDGTRREVVVNESHLAHLARTHSCSSFSYPEPAVGAPFQKSEARRPCPQLCSSPGTSLTEDGGEDVVAEDGSERLTIRGM